jgi:chromatin modification-related protein EAF6
MSSTFGGARDGPSGAPTPNSAGGGGGRTGALKKSSKKNAAGPEDSETDGRETKKARTSFGARK